MTASSPAWVADAVFYQIFPDRFASSSAVSKPANLEPWESEPTPNGFKGGDLLGVVEHLDYLRDLGITAIYLNPIFRSTANHRYHTTDFFEVDPILGGGDALDALLRVAHRRGIRVVLDGVFNHVGRGFYEFSHLLENEAQSPYLDWFHVRSWPLHPFGPADEDPGYDCWWDKRELPKLMTQTPAVRSMLWSVAEHWIRRGIDGWRLDVPNEIDDDGFWREFRARVKHLNPDAYIVGEIWDDAGRWLRGDQFDGVQNYLFTKACLGFFCAGTSEMDANTFEGTGLDPVEALDAAGFRSTVDGLISRYSWTATLSQLNQLDSHDTPRYLTIARDDESSFRLATLFQMTYPGAPCVFYGDEIGLTGGHDPGCRRGFPWDRSVWNEDLRAYVKSCIDLRRSHPVLRTGTFLSLYAQDGVYVFARLLGRDVAVVALNASKESRSITVELPAGLREALTLRGVWTRGPVPVAAGRIDDWRLGPRFGDVLIGSRDATS